MLLKGLKSLDNKFIDTDSVEGKDPFDHPVAGQSLTGAMGQWPWEKPAEIVDVNDAFDFVVKKIEEDPETGQRLDKQMLAGMPIESIVNTISWSGFAEGKWSPDIAELLKMPMSAYFLLRAQEKNIPFVMFNNTERDQGLSDHQVMANMRESNPDAYKYMKQKMLGNSKTSREEEGSFLTMDKEGVI